MDLLRTRRRAAFLDAARGHAMLGGGTATTSETAHGAPLASIDQFFGQVATADAIAAAWAAGGARPSAVAAGR
jgi:hypothetical protein